LNIESLKEYAFDRRFLKVAYPTSTFKAVLSEFIIRYLWLKQQFVFFFIFKYIMKRLQMLVYTMKLISWVTFIYYLSYVQCTRQLSLGYIS